MPATKRKMDFTNVKEGSNFRPRHKPEGDYPATVVDVIDGVSGAGNEQWIFTIKLDGDERSTYGVYAGVDEKNAWKIRKMFIAAGMTVPKKLVMVDPNKLVGKRIGVSLEDDEYEGRMRSKVQDYLPIDDLQPNADEVDDEDDEDLYETAPPKKRAAKKAAPVVEDDDEDEDDDDEEPAPPPRKRAAKKAPVVVEDDEEEDEEEDDEPPAPPVRRKKAVPVVVEEEDDEDDEDEPAPAPRKRAAKKAAAPTRRKAAVVEEDDEDDDLDLEDI